MFSPGYTLDVSVPKGLFPSQEEERTISVKVTPALMTVKNLTFWIVAQFNKETGVSLNVDEEYVIVSKKDGKIWKPKESALNIDQQMFNSIDGVTQLVMKRPPFNVKVKIDSSGSQKESLVKEIVLENLFETDSVDYFIEKLVAQVPNIITSPSMI